MAIIGVFGNASIRRADCRARLDSGNLPESKDRRSREDEMRDLRMIDVAEAMVSATRARCGCGNHGDWSASVSGTSGGNPCVWAGCGNCRGQAVGAPILSSHLREWRRLTAHQRATYIAAIVCDGTRAPAANVDMATIGSTIDAHPCSWSGKPL